ncbi:MAG: phosphatase PAP2 family protein [Pseudomonadales bacterium]
MSVRWPALPSVILLLMLLASSACTNVGPAGPYGLRTNSGGESTNVARRIAGAARAAAVQPGTWVPLAGAGLLALGSLDEDLAEWASREQPVFGANAADRSDDLRDFATLSFFASAAFAPSERLRDKFGGIAVGVGAMLVEGGVTEALKSVSSRQRPNGRGDRSFPSGHAAQASSRSVLTLRTLQHYQLTPWQRRLAQIGYVGTAGATAWARVEADKHYPTDVLVGLAIGSFLANFAHNLFLTDTGLTLTLQPEHKGVRLTLGMPLP